MAEQHNIENTKRLMGALVRMKPKPHEKMKVGRHSMTSPTKHGKKPNMIKKK